MTYNMTQEEKTLRVAVEGELDVRTSPEFQDALLPALDGVSELEIDLKDLNYISSAGLRVLLAAAKVMDNQGEMVVKNVSADVMDIFKITGFDDLLDVR